MTASRQKVDQRAEQLGLLPGHAARRQELFAAAAFDHVGGQRPGRAGESDQRHLWRQRQRSRRKVS